ncbi:hypothetical protein [Pseudochrobactrum sp. MP213Fo]|uniref:hypothetical protein n=1 Tax=Pseudochrobactrum sp. MP213Fo TaxID=3022250 RepID=UPI003BA39B75
MPVPETKRINIDPMAALSEAQSLNAYYANRVLILGNDVSQLTVALNDSNAKIEQLITSNSEANQMLIVERDRLLTDLNTAHEAINKLSVEAPKKVSKHA